MPKINVIDNIKDLREILCIAQSLGQEASWNLNRDLYSKRIQELINELDYHRPLGPDGKHGNLHTNTCGCKDKGHGAWCTYHICCAYSFISYMGGVCDYCGHVYDKLGPVPVRQ